MGKNFFYATDMDETKRKFTVELEGNLATAFSEVVVNHGWLKTRAVRGAVKVFLALPTDLQVKVMALNNNGDVYQILIEGLLDVELEKELDALGPEKAAFLAAVKQARAKVSRKK
jgi:hypothetical protein